jgi:hypothetical protein
MKDLKRWGAKVHFKNDEIEQLLSVVELEDGQFGLSGTALCKSKKWVTEFRCATKDDAYANVFSIWHTDRRVEKQRYTGIKC